jgi:NAD(P)H-flavin reductase/hemoglobin-like flavoprotein
VDAQALKNNFAQVAQHGDAVALFFYSDLFLRNPALRDMFPIGMSHQRDRLLSALGRIVSQVDNLPEIVPFVRQLGTDHRKFGVEAFHFPEVGQSLVTTLRYFSGAAWNDTLAKDWSDAYGIVAKVMIEAAEEDAAQRPAWWNARIVAHERRRFDLAVLRVVLDRPMAFTPGQAVAVETRARPRMWRYYSMANAPRADNSIDFHVRLVDGGPVSPVLVRSVGVGDWLRLGAPVGTMTFDDRSGRDVLLIGGSTGLAPLKAILDRIAQNPAPPRVHLFFGARAMDGLYDLEDLAKRAAESPWLTVVPAVSEEEAGGGVQQGSLVDVVARQGLWRDHDAYVCGSPAMVNATADRLLSLGLGAERIRLDKFADAADA